jgi:hypothetical protein
MRLVKVLRVKCFAVLLNGRRDEFKKALFIKITRDHGKAGNSF